MIQISYQQQGTIGQISAQYLISSKGPIYRIATQVIIFMIGAFIFMLLDYYFQSQTYIIVYVGAIAIQFLFVIMQITLQTDSGGEIRPIKKKEKIEIIESEISANIQVFKLNRFNQNKQISTINGNKNNYVFGQDMKNIIFSYFQYQSNNMEIFKKIKEISNKEEKKQKFQKYSFYIPNFSWVNNKTFFSSYINISIFIISFIIIIQPIFLAIYNMPIGSYIQESNLNIFTSNFSFVNIYSLFSDITIYNYFYTSWAIEYKTITDIENQAIIVYVAYPTAQILISIALWTVMIGIISICSPRI